MENKFGIENLKRLLAVFCSFVMMGDKMGHENNWSSRMTHLFGFFPSLMDLGSIKWSELDDEVKDVSEDEKSELMLHLKEKFDLVDDKLESLVEEGLDFAAYVGGVVTKAIDYINKVKDYFKK